MGAGAPKGNKNAFKGKLWTDAIIAAVESWPEPPEKGANKLMTNLYLMAHEYVSKMYADKDLGFWREFGDRLEGKPSQSVEVSGGDKPLIHTIERKIVDKAND